MACGVSPKRKCPLADLGRALALGIRRRVLRHLHFKGELESTSNAMGEWEVIAMEERSMRESLGRHPWWPCGSLLLDLIILRSRLYDSKTCMHEKK